MWSRKFAAAGLFSATILAALASFAILFVFYLVLHRAMPGAVFVLAPFFSVGVFAYPACWHFMIQRTRDYGTKRTLELVWATYRISCLIVIALISLAMVAFAAFFLVAVVVFLFGFLFGSIEPNWRFVGDGLLAIGGVIVAELGMIVYVVMVALITLPVFSAIAIPIAYLHRWLLLKIFASNDSGMVQASVSP